MDYSHQKPCSRTDFCTWQISTVWCHCSSLSKLHKPPQHFRIFAVPTGGFPKHILTQHTQTQKPQITALKWSDTWHQNFLATWQYTYVEYQTWPYLRSVFQLLVVTSSATTICWLSSSRATLLKKSSYFVLLEHSYGLYASQFCFWCQALTQVTETPGHRDYRFLAKQITFIYNTINQLAELQDSN